MTLDDINAAVAEVRTLPLVRFNPAAGEDASRWINKKHATGNPHEPATIAAFLAARKQRKIATVYDVGALFGYFSLVAQQVFDGVAVVAFEMHPGAIKKLMLNVPGIACVRAALSDETCYKVKSWISGFNIYREPEGGWDRLADVPGAMKQRGENNRGRAFHDLDFVTLDGCLAEFPDLPKPDLIKIDVEGYQAKAIRGAMGTIAAHKPIIVVELHDLEKLARFGTTNKRTVQPLYDLGYRGFWCGNHRDMDARFEAVAEMAERHERLSIMVFAPRECV